MGVHPVGCIQEVCIPGDAPKHSPEERRSTGGRYASCWNAFLLFIFLYQYMFKNQSRRLSKGNGCILRQLFHTLKKLLDKHEQIPIRR